MSTKEIEDIDELERKADAGEFGISDELYRISEGTNKDGTVDVIIYDFEKLEVSEHEDYDTDMVRVHFYTPTVDKQSEVMKWPKKDSSDYKFVRICRKTCGSLAGAKWLKNDGARIKADPDSWRIKAKLPKRKELSRAVKTMSLSKIIFKGGMVLLVGAILAAGGWFLAAPVYALMTLSGWVAPLATTSFIYFYTWVGSFFFMLSLFSLLESLDES